jgi:hypothetical protein
VPLTAAWRARENLVGVIECDELRLGHAVGGSPPLPPVAWTGRPCAGQAILNSEIDKTDFSRSEHIIENGFSPFQVVPFSQTNPKKINGSIYDLKIQAARRTLNSFSTRFTPISSFASVTELF